MQSHTDKISLRGSRISVFTDIALRMDANNITHASIDSISEDTAYSRRKVIASIEDLVTLGLIEVEVEREDLLSFKVNTDVAQSKEIYEKSRIIS